MTLIDLSKLLKDMYDNAPSGEREASIHLFGIKYADEIRKNKYTPKTILKSAKISESYQSEINKGIKLSKYVVAKRSNDN